MSATRSRALRAGLESLERRETPSTHAAAAAATVINLRSTGTAVISQSRPAVNSQYSVTLITSNSSKKSPGPYTGELDVYYGVGTGIGVGTGTITTATGDQVNLTLHSRIHIPTHALGQGGVIHFKVTGGTGAFANATGHGTLTGNVNYIYPYTFTAHGQIRA